MLKNKELYLLLRLKVNRVLRSQKGQTLALFVIFVPLILIMGTFVIDMGLARYNKNKINEVNKNAIYFGLNHLDRNPKDEMVTIINKNIDNIDSYKIDIDVSSKTITSEINASSKGVFGSIVGKKLYKIKSVYKGFIKDGKSVIERSEQNGN